MLTKLQQTILFTGSFSLGLLIPVLNLVLLEKGADLRTLPLLLAAYALVVLLFELPSGICADLFGRKAVYLISCGFQILSAALLILADSMIWLVIVVIFFGLGRAFASGSLDALFIDEAIAGYGDGCLAKVTARMAIIEGGGLAIGGFTGGLIADVYDSYLANLGLRLILAVGLLITCAVFVNGRSVVKTAEPGVEPVAVPVAVPAAEMAERPDCCAACQPRPEVKRLPSLKDLLRTAKQAILGNQRLGLLLPGFFCTGFLLCTVETYWQPAFVTISPAQGSSWLLGVITAAGFLAVVFGNLIGQKLLGNAPGSWWMVYKLTRIAFSLGILFFAGQSGTMGFIASYAVLYLLLGASNVAESTLVNQYTPNHLRASMLSFVSLTAQVGSLAASVFSSLLILQLRFAGLWLVAAGLIGSYTVFQTLAAGKKRAAALK